MKLLEYKVKLEYPKDVERMRSVLNAAGYDAAEQDLDRLWSDHSAAMCAGWMRLPDDDGELLGDLLFSFGIEKN